MVDFPLRHHIEAVSGAHRSSCQMSDDWSVANHSALYRSSAEGEVRLELPFHPLICNSCHWTVTLNAPWTLHWFIKHCGPVKRFLKKHTSITCMSLNRQRHTQLHYTAQHYSCSRCTDAVNNRNNAARFEAVTAVLMTTKDSWDVAPCWRLGAQRLH